MLHRNRGYTHHFDLPEIDCSFQRIHCRVVVGSTHGSNDHVLVGLQPGNERNRLALSHDCSELGISVDGMVGTCIRNRVAHADLQRYLVRFGIRMVADSCPSLDRVLSDCHVGHVVCSENSIEGKSPVGWADYHRK